MEIFILGGGSNVLIADEGFDGLVIKIALRGITLSAENDETVFVTAGAGEDWDALVAFCVGENLQGFECLSGIPGFVGGRLCRTSELTDRKFRNDTHSSMS